LKAYILIYDTCCIWKYGFLSRSYVKSLDQFDEHVVGGPKMQRLELEEILDRIGREMLLKPEMRRIFVKNLSEMIEGYSEILRKKQEY
jgi:hypothetical protein